MKVTSASHLLRVVSDFAAASPHSAAVAARDGTLSYRELSAAAARAAESLSRLGVGPGDTVVTMAERSWHSLAAILGIWKVRAAYAPVHPDTPADRLSRLSRLIRPRLLLSNPGNVTGSHEMPVVDVEDLFTTQARTDWSSPRLDLADPAYVIFTSGSTGTPKAVQISHKNLASYCWALQSYLRPPSAADWGSVSPLWTDLGHTAIFGALGSGGCVHLVDEDTYTSAARFSRYCGSLDYVKITPTHLWALVGDCYPGGLPRRGIILGGEQCPPHLVATLQAMAPSLEIYNHYGPTECTVGAAAYRIPSEPISVSSPIPIGRALPGVRITVRDDAGREIINSDIGELWIGGDIVGRYIGSPDGSGFAYSATHSEPEYRTGDCGFRDVNGNLVLVGRRDRQLKIRGHRIEPAEVEATLSLLPGVLRVVVFSSVDADGTVALSAAVVSDPTSEVTASKIQQFASKHLPEFMIPRRLAFLASLPYQENGKLDERLLMSHVEGVSNEHAQYR